MLDPHVRRWCSPFHFVVLPIKTLLYGLQDRPKCCTGESS